MMVKWVRSFFEDKDGQTSSKKLALIVGSSASASGVVALSISKSVYVWNHGGDVSLELMALAGSLCTLAGYSYVQGKKAEASNEQKSQ